ncbi:MAG: phosphoribosyltransferase [Promethearchaeota archaeon]|jgi:hypoxanthine phosphoribosyltransferase
MKFTITEEQIKERVDELAQEVYDFFKNEQIDFLYLIFILTSSFVFASDLMRALSKLGLEIQTDVISVKSYVGTESGDIIINPDDIYRQNLNDKNILIVDDILDTGKTLTYVKKQILETYKPRILEFCCFLEKNKSQREFNFKVRFVGFKIPDLFVIGYGLDCDGKNRELPYVTEI